MEWEGYLDPGGRVFADTCSLMHRRAERFFLDVLAPRLRGCGASLVVPLGVVRELQRFRDEDSRRGRLALGGYGILQHYQREGILDLRGDEGDCFPDQLFLSLFARFLTQYDLCLITQDKKLASDLRGLAGLGSVQRKRSLEVFGISRDGDRLVSHEEPRRAFFEVPGDPVFPLATKCVASPPPQRVSSRSPGPQDPLAGDRLGSVRLVEPLGEGGEGTCWATEGGLVCKLYRPDRIGGILEAKMRLLVEGGCRTPRLCWPRDLVRDQEGRFVGILMDRAEGVDLQRALFVKPLLEKTFPHWTRRNLVGLALDVVEKVRELHRRNVLLGDLNPRNILVDPQGQAWFVDLDSCQVAGYPCPVGTPTFTPPEIQGRDFKTFLRTPEQEQFALATLVFMILLPGKPPYSQQGGSSPEENIRLGNFPYAVGEKRSGAVPRGPWRNLFSHLPWALKDAFEGVFNRGDRYSADRWEDLLRRYHQGLEAGWFCDDLFPRGPKILDPVATRCPSCGQEFWVSAPTLEQRIVQGKDCFCEDCRQDVLVACDQCDQTFPMPRFLLADLQKKGRPLYCPHCRTPERLRCSRCGGVYKTASFMAKKVHEGVWQPLCPECREASFGASSVFLAETRRGR